MEGYTAGDFIRKSRYYLSLAPPDLLQSAEKTWFAAVYAVKQLYLSCGGINMTSHNSLKYFCRFAIDQSQKSFVEKYDLCECWAKAEKMHRDAYGSGNYRPSQFAQIISEVERFVQELQQMDRLKLWRSFELKYIKGSDPNVEVKQENYKMNLGGVEFDCEYSVFVKL